jgi:hypothetical protein
MLAFWCRAEMRPSRFYWRLAELGVLAALAALGVFATSSADAQLLPTIALLVGHVLVVLVRRPYARERRSRMWLRVLVSLTAAASAALAIVVHGGGAEAVAPAASGVVLPLALAYVWLIVAAAVDMLQWARRQRRERPRVQQVAV